MPPDPSFFGVQNRSRIPCGNIILLYFKPPSPGKGGLRIFYLKIPMARTYHEIKGESPERITLSPCKAVAIRGWKQPRGRPSRTSPNTPRLPERPRPRHKGAEKPQANLATPAEKRGGFREYPVGHTPLLPVFRPDGCFVSLIQSSCPCRYTRDFPSEPRGRITFTLLVSQEEKSWHPSLHPEKKEAQG